MLIFSLPLEHSFVSLAVPLNFFGDIHAESDGVCMHVRLLNGPRRGSNGCVLVAKAYRLTCCKVITDAYSCGNNYFAR